MVHTARLPWPLLKAALTSGSVMATGDALCQQIQASCSEQPQPYELARTLRFGCVGLTLHGPFFHYGYRALDRAFGSSQSLGTAFKKVLAGHVTLFPLYTAAFFSYIGLLEGKPAQQIWQKFQDSAGIVLVGGVTYWTAANALNFMYIAPTHRVAYVNGAGLVWQTALSYVNASKPGQLRTDLNAAGSTEGLDSRSCPKQLVSEPLQSDSTPLE